MRDRRFLALRRRDRQHPALAEPDVGIVPFAERAHGGGDLLTGPAQLEGRVAPEAPCDPRQPAPEAVEEAAVAAARPVAARLCLEQDDVE